MARLLRIERAIRWMAKVLTANRDALPFPKGITDQVNPTIDVFGVQRIAESQVETVTGGVGVLEVLHTVVPPDTTRYYLSMEYVHGDGVDRRIRPGRVVPTATAFPFIGLRDEELMVAGEFRAVQNFWVGPNMRVGVQAPVMGAAASMSIEVVWVELPLGESVQF